MLVACLMTTSALDPVLCINCKFFKKDLFTASQFGKCTKFPEGKKENNCVLVDGVARIQKINYHYCVTSRDFDSMCGNEGKFYQERRVFLCVRRV